MKCVHQKCPRNRFNEICIQALLQKEGCQRDNKATIWRHPSYQIDIKQLKAQ